MTKSYNLGKEESLLSKQYEKLEKGIDIIDSIQLEDWTITNTLQYIMKKYQEKFNNKFILSYMGVPSKSPEYKLTSRIWLCLNAKKGDGLKVKNYIDWFYDNYNGKKPFVSIGAFPKVELVAKFKNAMEKASIIKTTTILPTNILSIVSSRKETEYMKTFGDLLFLKMSLDSDPVSTPVVYKEIFDQIKQIGFDLSLLDKIAS